MAFKMKGNPLKMGSMATKSGMKMAKESAMKMKKESPMEMKKGSAMKLSEEDKKKAMDNAMPAAEKKSMSRQTMDSAKGLNLMTASGAFDKDKAAAEIRKRQNVSGGSERYQAQRESEIAEIRRLMKSFS